ncbi:MAG: bifunctional methylenetetrahydrofolate dehydrogenase/methenyltetrahydrofolate cyclohydrolase FolD [Clostridia bacterium]|nr:bifunctional methylenetetrahydrofolate dehydrogenase/methenyltetrahydrofolate cyclohydrolase FolD [Clostridia bacterium]
MNDKIINGKAVAEAVRQEIKKKIISSGISPSLAVIIVGEDPASKVYVRNKRMACENVGIKSQIYELPEETEEGELIELIETLNRCEDVNGILVQMPLPRHISSKRIISAILPEKDVDAFNPVNVGKIVCGDYAFVPCTPAGIIELLDFYKIQIAGKRSVVIGRSDIVGKPLSLLLLHRDATVTVCHSKTTGLKEICREAEILVSAVGKPGFVTVDMVRDNAVVIDVGINRVDGKLCGDVDFSDVYGKVSMITPVPGGVGPMTVTMLLKNTVTAWKIQHNS